MKISNSKKKFVYLISPNQIKSNFYKDLREVLSLNKTEFFQLRLKNVSSKKKIIIGKKIKKICKFFKVKFLVNDDPIIAKKLEDLGASAIMPLASPIGSGRGIKNKLNLSIIVSNAKIPVIVDAGIGTASDATIAMELGCDGVLINTAIAKAKDPIMMATSMKHAVLAGRKSYLAGRIGLQKFGLASSPNEGLI